MNPKEKGITLLDAITDGKQSLAFKLIREGADLTVQRRGDYAIHLAAQRGDIDIIQALKGVDLSLRSTNGNTPAHYAAVGGHIRLLEFLTHKGVQLNTHNKVGNSPLHDAVLEQPMDIIESLIDFGMDPNRQNPRTGQTPTHLAAIFGRRMAIEALILNGAKLDIKDRNHNKPEDVARDEDFRQVIRQYEAMKMAFGECAIQAAGMKITNKTALQITSIDRVGIFIDCISEFDVPRTNPASFYCRREKSENSSVPLKQFPDEYVFSDVFFVLLSNSHQGCRVRLLLPLYTEPSAKEELILRFISSGEQDRTVEEIVLIDKKYFCPVLTTLIPEVTCICLLYVRPKQEEFFIGSAGTVLETTMEPEFYMDIPPGAFSRETLLTIKIFDTKHLNVKKKRVGKRRWGMTPPSCPLLTSVFEINITGNQPKKAITIQMPVTGDTYKVNEMVILNLDENGTFDRTSDVIPMKPKFINNNLIFTIKHFSTYVAVPKEKLVSNRDINNIQKHISHAKERRKPATFFAAVKSIYGSFVLLVDFGQATKSHERFVRWKREGFKVYKSSESEQFMVEPGERYNIDLKGDALFENPEDGRHQKFCFSSCRQSCYQTFKINVKEDMETDERHLEIIVYKQDDSNYILQQKEVCRLHIRIRVSIKTELPSLVLTETPGPGIETPTPKLSAQMQRTKRLPSTPKKMIGLMSEKNMLPAQAQLPKSKVDLRVRLIEPCHGEAYLSSHKSFVSSRSKHNLL